MPGPIVDPNDPDYCWYLTEYNAETGSGGSDLVPPFGYDISLDPLEVIDKTTRTYDFYYDARNTVAATM